jgi:spore protease
MFCIFGTDFDEDWGNVSCIRPGVTGMTGIETAQQVKCAVDLICPDQVIIIDSLASKSIKRVSTTIQINNAGIEPGSGMGNMRAALNEEYLGCKVVCIGVPTVIDAGTIIREALEEHIREAEEIDRYIESHHQELIVTSTDIDQLIKDFSDIISNGINKTLHHGIYS